MVRAAITVLHPRFMSVLWEVGMGSQKVSSMSNVACGGEEEEKTRNSRRVTGEVSAAGTHGDGWSVH